MVNSYGLRNLGVPDNHYGFVSSLLIFRQYAFSYNTIIIKIRKLIALDVANGNQRWVKNRPGKNLLELSLYRLRESEAPVDSNG